LTLVDDLVSLGTLTNNGILQQTRDVNGTSDVGFFADPSYGGVILNANGADLGSTVVQVAGNTDCTSAPPGSSVKRCLGVTPTNATGRDATLRFYFSASELGSINCAEVRLWHWTGTDWQEAGTLAGRDCSSEPYYVEYSNVSSFSPFAADNDNPGSPPLEPTAAELARFEATAQSGGILLEWETLSETDNLGFHLYRSEAPDGPRTRLNRDLISGQAPGSPEGAAYTWLDDTVRPGMTYYYWLEDVDIYGRATEHGPVLATAQGPGLWQLPTRRGMGRTWPNP
jgi:hypothetical protein